MTPKSYVAPEGEPDDVVTGADPRVVAGVRVESVLSVRVSCPACSFSVLVPRLAADETIDVLDLPGMGDHLRMAHAASRADDLTCHARPPWDHDRWCVRPKDHDGRGHWTPSFGGGRWWRVW